MTNLREAREQGTLDQFINEREAETGDADALNRAVRSMAETSPKAPKASAKGNRGG